MNLQSPREWKDNILNIYCLFLIKASLMVVGSLTGALCGGIQSGKFGRKKSLMLDNVVFLVGILILCLAPNFYLILLARFITGHSTASALVAAPIYASEISQPQTRKIMGSFQLMCFTSGFALSFVLGKYQFFYTVGL